MKAALRSRPGNFCLDKPIQHVIIGTDKALMRPVADGTVQREADLL